MATIPLFPGISPTRYTEDDFRRDVESFGFLAIRRLAEMVYQDAPGEARRLFTDPPEVRRMTGHIRHSMLEQELRNLGQRGDITHLTSKDEPLKSKRGYRKPGSYVSINYGEIVITQSHTDLAEQLPPVAVFRKNKARINQWTLSESVDGNGPQRYIVVTHGPSKINPEEPAFIQAGFLHPSGESYLYTYDLLALPIDKIMGIDTGSEDIKIDIELIEQEKEEGDDI